MLTWQVDAEGSTASVISPLSLKLLLLPLPRLLLPSTESRRRGIVLGVVVVVGSVSVSTLSTAVSTAAAATAGDDEIVVATGVGEVITWPSLALYGVLLPTLLCLPLLLPLPLPIPLPRGPFRTIVSFGRRAANPPMGRRGQPVTNWRKRRC